MLPVPGFGTAYPSHSCGKNVVDAMLETDGLDPSKAWSQLSCRFLVVNLPSVDNFSSPDLPFYPGHADPASNSLLLHRTVLAVAA